MGIARAYKAPSLYQTNPNYLLYSKAGCYASSDGVGCYMMGNDDLKAETSINKEIGLEWKRDGWLAGVTGSATTIATRLKRAMRQSARPPPAKSPPISTSGRTCRKRWLKAPKVPERAGQRYHQLTNNITYMLQSKNKETGDRLSIIPEYTLNSTLSWQVHQDVSLQSTFTGTASSSRRSITTKVSR